MKYISSDTNVWIDFYKISKTQLPFRMSCKYIMFHEAIEKELLYPKDLKSQLIDGGLLGVEITTEELFYADELSKKYRKESVMMEISKADWKLYRERVGGWQEHYMEKLVKQYIKLLSSPGNASDHFWELEKRIKSDRRHPGVIIELRKSEAIWDIAMFVQKKVIKMEDLEGFSDDLIEAVKLILSR